MANDNVCRDDILDRLRSCPNFDALKFIYLYGSYAAGETTERSDIDLCLYYDIEDRDELYKTLFQISGSFTDEYDIQMFQLLPLYVQKEVFKGELIYADEKDFVYDIARQTVKEYNDFEPRYKYILYGKAGMEGAEI